MAPVIENLEVKGNSQQCYVDFVHLPDLETNLLGRDFQVQLGVEIIPVNGKMVVHMMRLTTEGIGEINSEVWAEEGKLGI